MIFEEILAGLIFYSRFIIIAIAVIIPIVLLLLLIYSMFKQRYKWSLLLILGVGFSIVFVYLVFFDFQVSARIDTDSIIENKAEIVSLKSGEYEFDAGYIVGKMYVYDEEEFATYIPTIEVSEVYDIDNDTTCSVSLVSCCKDERLSYAFSPTISSGEFLIENDKKIIEVYYYYYHSINPILSITNPELFYRPKIDVGDILQTYIPMDQSDQSGDGSMIEP